MASCAVLIGFVFLFFGFLACGVSFCAPFWLYNHNNYQDIGLWGHGYCNRKDVSETIIGSSDGGEDLKQQFLETCNWRWAWQNEWAWEKDKLQHEWFVATQVLFGIGVVLMLLVLVFLASPYLCCGCGKETNSVLVATGLLLLLSVAKISAAMVTFGVYSWKEWGSSVHSSTSRFSWGFYLGVGGVVVSGLSAVCFLIESCRGQRSHSGYARGEVV